VPTANERKALWFVAVVALSGSAVRLWRASAQPATASEVTALERQIARVDSVRALRHSRDMQRATRDRVVRDAPRGAVDSTRPLDLDRATATEIEALTGIGPALAQRFVAASDCGGTFGSLEALCSVSGVGPAIVQKLRPLVTFTGARRPLDDTCGEASKKPRKQRRGHGPESR